MSEFLSGVIAALLVIGVLNRHAVWQYITDEYRYRRDCIRVWSTLRQEDKK